jgi:hypothetical protein
LPLDLATLIERWPRILTRLAAVDAVDNQLLHRGRSRPRQVEVFRARFESQIRRAA